jgi:hypothetical protein
VRAALRELVEELAGRAEGRDLDSRREEREERAAACVETKMFRIRSPWEIFEAE